MPPPEESSWWRGKKGFQVGFFPCECVEIIGDKVPQSIKFPKVSSKPVLRKHGKLIAFFRSFLLSRPSRRKLKQSGILKERVFGCDLGEHLMNSGRDIPLVLKCCAEFIEEHGIVDGIYRLSGVTSNIQKLRVAFDEDRVPNLYDEAILQDIHCVASLLKMYFRELPNPLLTFHLYDKFVSAVQAEEDLRLLKLRDIVQQLPPPHYRSLEYLMRHLSKVAAHGYKTGMTPKNVAIVWAPNLLRSRDIENGGVGALHVVGVQAVLTEYLIRYTDIIFSEKMPIFPTLTLGEDTPKKTRPKSLAISTPTKLLSLEEARSRALTSNLLSEQQKFIDVGGGEENLPVKYHTVIELPARRRSVGKGKKSPSGWRSFFSRGWQTTSGRRKNRRSRNENERPKIGSPIFCGHSPLVLQDKAVTEFDVSHTKTKKLRTVKSAESLFPVHSSSVLKPHNQVFSPVDEHPSSHNENHQPSSHHIQSQPLMKKSASCQSHFRSTSHDSYFERILEQPEEDEGDQDDSIADDGHSHSSQNISFGLEKDVSSESDKSRSCETTPRRKIAQKQKLVSFDSEASSPKLQKISLKRLYHTLSSPPLVKKRDDQLETEASSSEKQSLIEKEPMQSRKIHVLPRNKSESCIKVDSYAVPLDIQTFHRTSKTLVPSVESSRAQESSFGGKGTVSVEVHKPLWDMTEESRTALLHNFENNAQNSSKEGSNDILSTEKISDPSSLPHFQSLDLSGDKPLNSTGAQNKLPELDFYPLSSSLTTPETGKNERDLIVLQQDLINTCDQSLNNIQTSSDNSPSVQTVLPQSVQSSMHESFSYDILKSFSSPDVPSYNNALDQNLSSDSSFVGSIILSPPENFVDDSSPTSQKECILTESKDDFKPPGTRGLERSMTEVHEICPKFATGISVSGSLSHELFKANSDFAEKKRSCSDKLSPISPIEESRRKFESEIGRLIVRDRQMKHEMEQIKAERQRTKQEKPSAPLSERVTSKNEKKFADVLDSQKSPIKSVECDKRKLDSDDVVRGLKDSVDDRKISDSISGYCSFLRLESKPSVKELLSKFEGPKREVSSSDACLKHGPDSLTSSPGIFSNVQVINHGVSSDPNQSSKDNQNSHSREHIFQTECVVRFPHPKTSSAVRQDCVDALKNGTSNSFSVNESFGSNSWTSGESDHLMKVSDSRTSFRSSDNLAPTPVQDRQTSFSNAGRSHCTLAEQSLTHQNGNSAVSLKAEENLNTGLDRPFSAFKDAFERASRLTHQMRSEFFQRGLSQETFNFGNSRSTDTQESCERSHVSRTISEGRRRPNQARPRPKSVPPPVNRLSVASEEQQPTTTNSFQNSQYIPKLDETTQNVPKTSSFRLNGSGSPSTSQIHDPPKRIKERAALFERSLSFSGYADRKTQPPQKAQSNSSGR